MTKKELEKLLIEISSHYRDFKLNDLQKEYWFNTLKDYSNEEINYKFKKHLKGEYSHREPQLAYLYNGLKTIEQKEIKGKRYIACRICGKEYDADNDWDSWEKCEERCRKIKYLKTQAKKYNFKIKVNLENMELDEIDKVYYQVLEHIKNKVPIDGEFGNEKKIIERVLATR